MSYIKIKTSVSTWGSRSKVIPINELTDWIENNPIEKQLESVSSISFTAIKKSKTLTALKIKQHGIS